MKTKQTRVKDRHAHQPAYAMFTTGLGGPIAAAAHASWPFTVNPKLAPLLQKDPKALIRTAMQLSAVPTELDLPAPLTPEQRAFMSGALLQRPFLIVDFNTVGIQVMPQVGQRVGTTPDELHGYTDRADRLLRLDEAGRLVSQRAGDGRRLLAGMQREAGRSIDGFYVKQLATLPVDSPVRAQYLLDYAQIQVFQQRAQAQAGSSQATNAAVQADLGQQIEATELQVLAEQSLDRLRRGEAVDKGGLEAVYRYFSHVLEEPGGGADAGGAAATPATGKGQGGKKTPDIGTVGKVGAGAEQRQRSRG